MKIRLDGELATNEETFVDDIHVMGRESAGQDNTWRDCKRLKSEMNHVQNQAEDRKFRKPTPTPGPWNGGLLHIDTPFPMKSTTGKKWKRFRDGLKWIDEQAQQADEIDTAELHRIAGLGVNVTKVYPEGRPFLKGMYNALEAFREGRDVDGWRLQDSMEQAEQLEQQDSSRSEAAAGYPQFTRITDELKLHVDGLLKLFHEEEPPAVPIRPTEAGKIRYLVGDASAEGFGMAIQYPNLEIEIEDGLWTEEFSEQSSNMREAANHAMFILKVVKTGRHDGCKLWDGTDNHVWSMVWNKVLSDSRHLFYLALELRLVCKEHEVWLHVFHMSGNRMIKCGMGGISRGNWDSGIAQGFDLRVSCH